MRRLVVVLVLMVAAAATALLAGCGGSTQTVTVTKAIAKAPSAKPTPRYVTLSEVRFVRLCPSGQGFCVEMPDVPNTTPGVKGEGGYVEETSWHASHLVREWKAELAVGHLDGEVVYCTNREDILCGNGSYSSQEEYFVWTERKPWAHHITPDGCSDYPGGHGYTLFRGQEAFFERCPRAATGYFLEHNGLFIAIAWSGSHQPPYLQPRFERSFELN